MFRHRLATLFLLLSIGVQPLLAEISVIQIDFGTDPSPSPWINVSDANTGSVTNLTDTRGIPSNIDLKVFDAFNGVNTNGTQNPDPNLDIPGTASGDSFFGNTVDWSGYIEPTGGIRFSNLDPKKEYAFSIFASREASDNRETRYVCTGAQVDSAFLNVASNTDEIVFFADYPSAEGIIEIVASPGPNNSNSYEFFYMGAMIVEFESDYSGDPSLQLVHPNGGELWYNRANVTWKSVLVDSIMIEASFDNGESWELVDTVPGFKQKYSWRLPRIDADSCRVRITSLADNSLTDSSDSVFSIVSSREVSLHIVVLGSSTAAGTGASRSDSAWVNRYRNHLTAANSTIKVTNLAVGGYTTYHIMPDDFTPPSGKPSPSAAHNITKALSLEPHAIIINLPSNDAANSFSVEEQLSNYDVVLGLAAEQQIPVWVATTQPRSLSESQRANLMAVRDSTFARYGEKALDFWTDIATEDGTINELYNSGDNVHLNDAGHRVLFERVLAKNIPEHANLNAAVKDNTIPQPSSFELLENYPNPFNPVTTIPFTLSQPGLVQIGIYNLLGQKIKTLSNAYYQSGYYQINWNSMDDNGNHVGSGVYFIMMSNDTERKFQKAILLQ